MAERGDAPSPLAFFRFSDFPSRAFYSNSFVRENGTSRAVVRCSVVLNRL